MCLLCSLRESLQEAAEEVQQSHIPVAARELGDKLAAEIFWHGYSHRLLRDREPTAAETRGISLLKRDGQCARAIHLAAEAMLACEKS